MYVLVNSYYIVETSRATLTTALDHDDVVSKVRLDERRKDWFVYSGGLESKCDILEGAHH